MAMRASAESKADLRGAFRDLVAICTDGERGYEGAAHCAQDPSLRAFLELRVTERATFVAELTALLARVDGAPPTHGTPVGLLHRAWIDVRSLFRISDATIVEACLRGEAAAIRTYENAPKTVRELVRPQLAAIRNARSHLSRELSRLSAVPAETSRAHALAYAASHYTMTVATSAACGPWASTVMYVNDDLAFYFLSGPQTRHARNIASDPRVSATIDEDYASWADIKGIQLEGTADLVTAVSERERMFPCFLARFPFLRGMLHGDAVELARQPHHAMFRIRPTRLFFHDHSSPSSTRVEIRLAASHSRQAS